MVMGERKRGRWLSAWLIFIAGLYAIVAVVALVSWTSTSIVSDTERMAVPFLVVASVANVCAVVALWFWWKVGYYVFFVTAVPLIVLNLILGTQLLTALFPLYSLSTFWILLKPQWQHFD